MFRFWRKGSGARERPVNAVYEWRSWKGWYAEATVPFALRLKADPIHLADEILPRLPETIGRFLFHLDLTETSRFPLGRQDLLKGLQSRGIRAVNACVTDLRKSTVQSCCRELQLPSSAASAAGPPDELVIVKSEFNYGGRSERLLGSRQRRLLGVPSLNGIIRDAFSYQVMPRSQVPAPWWHDPALFIERFIDNREHRIWRVRVSLNHCVFSTGVSPRPVKKLAHCSDCTEVFLRFGERHSQLPRALLETTWRFLEGFHLEFGALDLIPDDAGGYFIIDANTTPGMGRAIPERMAFLRAPWQEPAP